MKVGSGQVRSSQKTVIIPHRAINLTNVRLINLRTCKGRPERMCSTQRRQVVLHTNL